MLMLGVVIQQVGFDNGLTARRTLSVIKQIARRQIGGRIHVKAVGAGINGKSSCTHICRIVLPKENAGQILTGIIQIGAEVQDVIRGIVQAGSRGEAGNIRAGGASII